MNKKPISISFANQKGGIGKSPLTILATSWLRCRGIFQRVSRFNLYRVQNENRTILRRNRFEDSGVESDGPRGHDGKEKTNNHH